MPKRLKNGAFAIVMMLLLPSALRADATDTNVLVIGVGGTNLSKILNDSANTEFLELIAEGTTGASTIVGHTTISNPSWTAIMTGVQSETAGVVNNVFTPWTHNSTPTVFNQLELFDPNINTVAIADWDVIARIASVGSEPADVIVHIPQIAGDTNWLATDDSVGDQTVAAISSSVTPTFVFTYFVGVDENGRRYGSDSLQYEIALRNVNDNIGEIMDAVDAREAAGGEEWTVIVVTDHGQQARRGSGRGFQSPDETTTAFVIAVGPDFRPGAMNNTYRNVDVTPTVVTLFGGTPFSLSDGVSLTTLGNSDVIPVDLHQALKDMLAIFGKLPFSGRRLTR